MSVPLSSMGVSSAMNTQGLASVHSTASADVARALVAGGARAGRVLEAVLARAVVVGALGVVVAHDGGRAGLALLERHDDLVGRRAGGRRRQPELDREAGVRIEGVGCTRSANVPLPPEQPTLANA